MKRFIMQAVVVFFLVRGSHKSYITNTKDLLCPSPVPVCDTGERHWATSPNKVYEVLDERGQHLWCCDEPQKGR